MENNKPVVVGIGELLWDMLPAGKRAGGAPVNFVYHAAQMGAEGYAVSAVGKDELGTEILSKLDENHIGHVVSKVDYPTGTVAIKLHDGIPDYTIIEDVAWDHIPLSDDAVDIIKRADAICYGTLAQRSAESRNTLMALLAQTRPCALRFYDINIRQHYYSKELIELLLQQADAFKINDEELEIIRPLFGLEDDTDKCCRRLMEQFGLRYLVLTAGADFSTIYTSEEQSTIRTPRVKVADTVGAGDSFSGAFVYSLLTGKTLREAHQAAVDTAAFVCTKEGAWPRHIK